ncbi:MAG: HAD family phosphatase [Spirochaetia bacterium]|nr:HAD family phosphatase [Spirochaetia bacterium]
MNSDKCIIFDMDGVLIDSEPLHFDFENRLFKSLGITVSQEVHETFVGTSSKTMWEIIKKTHSLPNTVPELVLKGNSEFLDYLDNQKSLELIKGIIELLQRLKVAGFNLILASSSPHKLINHILSKCNIDEYFPIRISGDDVNNGKPDPEIFLKAAEVIGVKPENCLVIEDSTNGVNAAVKAGMKCVGYRNPGSGNQDLKTADLILGSFDSLTIDLIQDIFTTSSYNNYIVENGVFSDKIRLF